MHRLLANRRRSSTRHGERSAVSSLVGASVPRRDADAKVRGRAVYGVDYSVPGVLHAKLLRSPIPSGLIKKLDISAALNQPGVRGVFTSADVTVARTGAAVKDQPLFARDVV